MEIASYEPWTRYLTCLSFLTYRVEIVIVYTSQGCLDFPHFTDKDKEMERLTLHTHPEHVI